MKVSIKTLYLYLFSAVGLIITIIASIGLVNLGLKAYVFTEADNYVYDEVRYVQPKMVGEGEVVEMSEEEIEERAQARKRSDRQREAVGSISSIIVGLPVYLYHWKKIKEEK